MASGSCFYDATVFRTVNGQSETSFEQVDLLNLEAGAFDKIVIDSDVDLGNGKANALPDFSNVEINGAFDCSRFIVSADSVLPRGITELTCFYSLSSLDVLMGILPNTVGTVRVRNAVINSIQKEPRKLQIAKDFIEKYPNVDVISKNNQRLRDVIAQQDSGNKEEAVKKVTTVKQQVISPAKDEPAKREGYLSIAEAADKLKNLPEFKGMATKEIRKQLKTFLYNNSDDPVWGNVQNYILEDSIGQLSHALLNQEVTESPKEEVTEQKRAPENKTETVEVKVSEKTVSDNDLKPIVIKKFFDKRVWSSVYKAVNGNRNQLVKFLNNISDVNLNPIQKDLRVGAGRVACLKNGNLKLVPNLELKNSCYIAQGFGRDNNRPRVIYCVMPGGELVASSFFANHGDGKNKCAYNSAILTNALRDKTVKSFSKSREDYIDVDDLLKEFSRDKDEPVVVVHEGVPLEPVPVIEPAAKEKETVTAEKPVIVPKENKAVESVHEKTVPEVEPVKPIASQKVEPVEEVKKPEAQQHEEIQHPVEIKPVEIKPVEEKKVEKPEEILEQPYFDNKVLYQINYEFEDVFSIINQEIMDIKQKLMSETDTNNSLKLAGQLSEKLKDKQLIEQNIEIAKKTFNMLKRYMNNSYSENVKKSL